MTNTEITDGIMYTKVPIIAMRVTENREEYKIKSNTQRVKLECFFGNKVVKTVKFEPGKMLLVIDADAFANSTLENIVLPSNTARIGANIFMNCNNLKYVKLNENLRTISPYAFLNCTELKKIEIPEGIKTICGSAFENCSSLEEVILPSSLVEIGDNTFRGCSKLKNITLPKSINKIGYRAFDDCSIENIYTDKETLIKLPFLLEAYEEKVKLRKLTLDELLDEGKSLKEISNIIKKQDELNL